MLQKMKKTSLSIVILSYNVSGLLSKCLISLQKAIRWIACEVIVIDNASSDASAEMVEKKFPWVTLVRNTKNLGFAAGNNVARKIVDGEFILFLNPDTFVYESTIRETLDYISKHKNVGVITCKMELPDGRGLDKDARRAFITPWIGLTHLFLKLDRIFPKSKLFSKYWYGYLSPDKLHEIDVAQGAYFLTRRSILDKLDWFDEDYFLDGEDIDLCWRIKNSGWKIVYFPEVKIIHFKGVSKGKADGMTKKKVKLSEKIRYRTTGVDSMRMFYTKSLWSRYPLILNLIILLGIGFLKFLRVTKTIVFG